MRRGYRNLFKLMIALGIVILGTMPLSKTDAVEKSETQNVLVLNSYHQGFSWTNEQTEGIIDTLQETGHNFSFRVEYMDWKNYNS